ncbi:MAG TPA: CocE/NonD family hydrolase [Pseudonocardia sp.]
MASPNPVTKMLSERDLRVTMRDGVRLTVDVYRPDTSQPLPVLYACSLHNKDMQGPDLADVLPAQPAYSSLWFGPIEAGDSRRLVTNGYAHVIAQARGTAKSEGEYLRDRWDHYDMIEWITQQPWCDGNVDMIGISAYAGEQWRAAAQGHPALKAIFPYDACSAFGGMFGFRDFHPGGVLHTMPYILESFSTIHESRNIPSALPAEQEELWGAAMANPDYRMYTNLYNILTQKGQRSGLMFHNLVEPWEPDGVLDAAQEMFDRIRIPFYTGSGAYAYSYKLHWLGAQHYFQNVRHEHRKLLFTGPAHVERPFHEYHDEILRWYDHWLKGVDTGILDEPPVRYWVTGANTWRTGTDWPLPETVWTKYYLSSWQRITTEPPALPDTTNSANAAPDAFVQMPPTQTRQVARLRFLSEPLPNDVLVAGPISLTLYASIDDTDTNWIIVLSDVGPDVSVRTAREGERDLPAGLPERELTRGWLKASYRAIDPERDTPWEPCHRLTHDAIEPVVPGEVVEYRIQILATANQFKAGHRICLDIMSADMPTGTGGMSHVEYQAYHVCRSTTVCHRIYRDGEHPSHLLLPIIPLTAGQPPDVA